MPSRVATLADSPTTRILLLAPDLLGESLALQLSAAEPDLEVILRSEALSGRPGLVIWSIDRIESVAPLRLELQQLQDHWQPAPLLLLLPAEIRLDATELLTLDCPGLLQDPDLKTLREAITTLRGGGRVLSLHKAPGSGISSLQPTMGLGQWLLVSGLQQISNDLLVVEAMLNPPPDHPYLRLLIEGRCRELHSARSLLLWIWGPLQMGLEAAVPLGTNPSLPDRDERSSGITSISLRQRNAAGVWEAIHARLSGSIGGELSNATGQLLAIEGLNQERRRDLLLALLSQLDQLLIRLRHGTESQTSLWESWQAMQPQVRQQALQTMAGSYVRLPRRGVLHPVAEQLIAGSDLHDSDDDLPEPQRMLAPLLLDQPVLVNGQLLPSDDPRALLQLETLVSNWLIRTAELISAEVLGVCGEWPELRRYLLDQRLISTRELERLRNRLNSQTRWRNWIEHPIALYESQRQLYRLHQGRIEPLLLTEPRDEELRQLGWWQQQVALILEARDALAPQVQSIIKRLGDLMVVLLTQVVGRAIGLVGRGIVQGMGRSLGRS